MSARRLRNDEPIATRMAMAAPTTCPGGGIHVRWILPPFPAANGWDRATDDAAMGGMTGRGRGPKQAAGEPAAKGGEGLFVSLGDGRKLGDGVWFAETLTFLPLTEHGDCTCCSCSGNKYGRQRRWNRREQAHHEALSSS